MLSPLPDPALPLAAGQHPGADGARWLALGPVDRSAARGVAIAPGPFSAAVDTRA